MVRAISALKRQPGKNIVVHGGLRTAQGLARQQPMASDTNPLDRTHRQPQSPACSVFRRPYPFNLLPVALNESYLHLSSRNERKGSNPFIA